MCNKVLEAVLNESARFGFDQSQRHGVGDVFRSASIEYRNRHPFLHDALDLVAKFSYLSAVNYHSARVSREYIREEIEKWQRRGYIKRPVFPQEFRDGGVI